MLGTIEQWVFWALTAVVALLVRWVWVSSKRAAKAIELLECLPPLCVLVEELNQKYDDENPKGLHASIVADVGSVLAAVVEMNAIERRAVILLQSTIRILVACCPDDHRPTISRIEADLRDQLTGIK
ncbi:MAG: hypothetical protein V3S03_08455 [Vicinamibacteria bacterium]